MDGRTTSRFRRRLLDELGSRGALLGKLRQSVAEQGQRYLEDGGAFASDMGEAATGEVARESGYLMLDAEGRHVGEIRDALQRIESGNFGACEWCNRAIERKRLEVLPYARFCLKCQEKNERLSKN